MQKSKAETQRVGEGVKMVGREKGIQDESGKCGELPEREKTEERRTAGEMESLARRGKETESCGRKA